MAKKIRKRQPSMATLFVKLLIPWIVMGGIAIAVMSAGYSDLAAFGAALSGALAVTYLIHLLDKKRVRRYPGK